MTGLPVLRYDTQGLPDDRAFAEWRALMAPMFRIDPARRAGRLPRGGVSSYLVGDIIANRCIFNAQHLSRDAALIAATPDHLVLQLYGLGGFHGELDGGPATIARGQVAVCDLGRTVDVRAATSNTIGLAVPKPLLRGLDLDPAVPHLDPARNRLLAARMTALYRSLPTIDAAAVPALAAELTAFLLRLLARSRAADLLEGPELDVGLMERAERAIRIDLASPDLTPARVAERLGISRATLFRLFAPLGGVMRRAQELRLLAVRDALADPLETRSLVRLAADHGFASPPHLSRSFRARFGETPTALRARSAAHDRQTSPDPVQLWWRRLGQPDAQDRRAA